MLLIDRDGCTLYELFAARQSASGTWHAGSGAIWDLIVERPAPRRLDERGRRRPADPAGSRALGRGGGRRDHARAPVHRARDARHVHLPGPPRGAGRTARRCRRWACGSGSRTPRTWKGLSHDAKVDRGRAPALRDDPGRQRVALVRVGRERPAIRRRRAPRARPVRGLATSRWSTPPDWSTGPSRRHLSRGSAPTGYRVRRWRRRVAGRCWTSGWPAASAPTSRIGSGGRSRPRRRSRPSATIRRSSPTRPPSGDVRRPRRGPCPRRGRGLVRLVDAVDGVLLAARPPRPARFVAAFGVAVAYLHDIGMVDMTPSRPPGRTPCRRARRVLARTSTRSSTICSTPGPVRDRLDEVAGRRAVRGAARRSSCARC